MFCQRQNEFTDRVWLGSKDAEILRKSKIRTFQSKPKLKLKQGQKLPSNHKGAVKKLAKGAKFGTLRTSHKEQVLQELFSRLVVDQSASMGLLGDTNALSAAGDGSPIFSGSSSYGIKCIYYNIGVGVKQSESFCLWQNIGDSDGDSTPPELIRVNAPLIEVGVLTWINRDKEIRTKSNQDCLIISSFGDLARYSIWHCRFSRYSVYFRPIQKAGGRPL